MSRVFFKLTGLSQCGRPFSLSNPPSILGQDYPSSHAYPLLVLTRRLLLANGLRPLRTCHSPRPRRTWSPVRRRIFTQPQLPRPCVFHESSGGPLSIPILGRHHSSHRSDFYSPFLSCQSKLLQFQGLVPAQGSQSDRSGLPSPRTGPRPQRRAMSPFFPCRVLIPAIIDITPFLCPRPSFPTGPHVQRLRRPNVPIPLSIFAISRLA